MLSQVNAAKCIHARKLDSVLGQIISMSLAIAPVSRFMTRSLYAVLESRISWCDHLVLSKEAQEEISFWVNCLAKFKSQPVWHSPSAVRVVLLMQATLVMEDM